MSYPSICAPSVFTPARIFIPHIVYLVFTSCHHPYLVEASHPGANLTADMHIKKKSSPVPQCIKKLFALLHSPAAVQLMLTLGPKRT